MALPPAKQQKLESGKDAMERLSLTGAEPVVSLARPTQEDIARGGACGVEEWFEQVQARAAFRLHRLLVQEPADGGVKLRANLCATPLARIANEDAAFHSYKEMYNPTNAVTALRKEEIYECGGSGLWFSVRRPVIDGAQLTLAVT